uniref:Transmembrane protein 106C n=1 Tax=Stegastes partitus TaxID=144197 RepID=A0A3B4ZWU3_9TELE
MGTRLSRSGSRMSLLPDRQRSDGQAEDRDSDNDSLDGLGRREDIARFPYVEFTGKDSITCPTCQGTGRIPSGQVNELVALIPYSDQRLRPQRTKQYVVLSVVLCLLASSLVAFFLFPRSVVVVDAGIRSVTVRFDHDNTRVLMNMTSTLNFSNPNFFSVLVQSVSCQVLYMRTVIGTQQLDNATTIKPLSTIQVGPNRTFISLHLATDVRQASPFKTHVFFSLISVFPFTSLFRTSVKTSYMVRTSQNSLEAYRYIDCGSNTTKLQSSGPVDSASFNAPLL